MDRRIVAYLWNPLFWLTVVLALIINTFQSTGWGPEWLRAYGMNFLALPVYFYLANLFLKWITRDYERKLSGVDQVIVWLLVSILFEWLLPGYSGAYVADIHDVIAYALGGVLWYPLLTRAQLFKAFKRLLQKAYSNA